MCSVENSFVVHAALGPVEMCPVYYVASEYRSICY